MIMWAGIGFIVSFNVMGAMIAAGDNAPRGARDGVLNVADLLVAWRFVHGQETPSAEELLVADVAPQGAPDGILDVADLLILQRAVYGQITLSPVNTAPDAPILNSFSSPTSTNPVSISGTAEANSVVQLYVNGIDQQSVIADSNGEFSEFIVLVPGDNAVYAVAHLNNEISPSSNVLNINLINTINNARLSSMAWIVQNQNGDGSWRDADQSSVRISSEVVLAMRNAGLRDGAFMNSALAFLRNANPISVDTVSRQLKSLKQSGIDVTHLVSKLLNSKNGSGTWGAYPGYGSSLPDTPLALISLFLTDNFSFTYSVAYRPLCDGFLYARRPDNSFSYLVNGTNVLVSQSSGSIMPTSYAAMLLAQLQAEVGVGSITCYRVVSGSTVPTTFNFNTSATNAAVWLIGQQNVDGGFGMYGVSNPLETAMAYLAIQKVSPTTFSDQLADAMNYLVLQQLSNGSWNNDMFTTAIVQQALPTFAAGTLIDSDGNGIPDAVEQRLNSDFDARSREGADGGGHATGGVSYSQTLPIGYQNLTYNYTLQGGLGNPPFAWTLISGNLPDGLDLNTETGLITGVPTSAGTFNFIYRMTDAYGSERVASQIQIVASP